METDFFDIVAGVQQGDTSTPYMFIICLDYVLRTSIDLKKKMDLHRKRCEENDTPYKLSQTRISLKT